MSKSSGCCLRACYSYSRFHPRVASLIAAQKVCAQAGSSVPHLAEESFDLEEAIDMKINFSCIAPGQNLLVNITREFIHLTRQGPIPGK